MKLFYISGIVIVVILIGFFVWLKQEQVATDNPQVCFDEICFNVEIVDTPSEREIGLMNRAKIDSDYGMLFIFESVGYYPFWMKNTLIPLDMIWIDSSGEVVYIYENALPCEADPCEVISPSGDALYVFEINGGLSSQKGIVVGQIAKFINLDGDE